MLEAVPTNIFSLDFQLRQQGRLVGELHCSVLRERGKLELEEGSYEMYRERLFSGDFFLERNGEAIARAIKPSIWRDTFEVSLLNRVVVLRRVSIFGRRFGVFENENQIGGISPISIFTRGANIDLPADWPLATRSFVYWLAFLIWKRHSDSS